MNILILNVHSALNLGDDAIMYSTLQSLGEKYPEAQITVAANDPDSWSKYHKIKVVSALCTWVANCRLGLWRENFVLTPFVILSLIFSSALFRLFGKKIYIGSQSKRNLLEAYYNTDLVLSCGGGNFYAHRELSPGFVWNLLAIGFAIGLGKRVIMLPQSIGPIEHRWQRSLARLVLNRVDRIMIREPESEQYVKSTLKLSKKPVLIPDLAFGLPSVEAKLPDDIPLLGNRPRIGVTMIDRGQQNPNFPEQGTYEDAICSLLIRLSQEKSAAIFLISQCYGPSPDQDDRHVTHHIYERLKDQIQHLFILDNFNDALEVKSAIAEFDFVIGTRMHTGIFALSSEVPVILIGYQPKACGMMDFFGLPQYCCNIEEVSIEELERLVNDLFVDFASVRDKITTNLSRSRNILSTWTQYL